MTQCAVGARCPKCAAKFSSHVVKVTPVILARTGGTGLFIGFIYGCLQATMHLSMFGILTWVMLVVAGLGSGKLLHRVSGYKLGARISAAAAVSLLVGVILSPLRDTINLYLVTLTAVPGVAAKEATSQLVLLLCAVLLFVGAAVSPFLRKS
jgi:hypothetical protein